MSTVRTTISVPESLYQKAISEMQDKDFDSFSGYVAQLIREDVAANNIKPGQTPQTIKSYKKLKRKKS
jgi:hypothetical protein